MTNSDQSTDTGALSVANTLRSQRKRILSDLPFIDQKAVTDVVVVGIGSEVNSEFLAALATGKFTRYISFTLN